MASDSAMIPDDFDVQKTSLKKQVKKYDSGAKQAYGSYDGGPCKLQLYQMRAPFGINGFKDKATGEIKDYTLELSLGDVKKNKRMKQLHEIFLGFEEKIKQEVRDNCELYLGRKKLSADGADELFTPIVRESVGKDGTEYPPRIRFKVKFQRTKPMSKKDEEEEEDKEKDEEEEEDESKKKVSFVALNENDEEFDLTLGDFPMTRGAKVRMVIRYGGIWISAGKFGAKFVIDTAQFEFNQTKTKTTMRKIDDGLDNDDDNTGEDDSVPVPKKKVATPEKKKKVIAAAVDSSEDESEDEDKKEKEETPKKGHGSKNGSKKGSDNDSDSDDDAKDTKQTPPAKDDDSDSDDEPPPPKKRATRRKKD
jgi:hypothetical protein